MPVDVFDELLAKVRALELAGDLPQAIATLEAVPEQQKERGLWAFVRGALALRSNDVDGAVTFFEHAVDVDPEIAEYWANLGSALLARARGGNAAAGTRALEVFETALRWAPKQAEVWASYAVALLLAGKKELALKACDDALARAPDHPAATFNRAAVLAALGREREALTVLDALVKAQPALSEAQVARTRLAAKLGVP